MIKLWNCLFYNTAKVQVQDENQYPHDMWKIKCVEYTEDIQLMICEGSNISKCKNQIQGGPRVDNLWKLLAVGQPLSVGQFIHAHLPPPVQIQIQIQLQLQIHTTRKLMLINTPLWLKNKSTKVNILETSQKEGWWWRYIGFQWSWIWRWGWWRQW